MTFRGLFLQIFQFKLNSEMFEIVCLKSLIILIIKFSKCLVSMSNTNWNFSLISLWKNETFIPRRTCLYCHVDCFYDCLPKFYASDFCQLRGFPDLFYNNTIQDNTQIRFTCKSPDNVTKINICEFIKIMVIYSYIQYRSVRKIQREKKLTL
jgi:hypothetical protein